MYIVTTTGSTLARFSDAQRQKAHDLARAHSTVKGEWAEVWFQPNYPNGRVRDAIYKDGNPNIG